MGGPSRYISEVFVKIQKKKKWGGGRVGGQGGCEQRIEVFVKIPKKIRRGEGSVGGGGGRVGVRVWEGPSR